MGRDVFYGAAEQAHGEIRGSAERIGLAHLDRIKVLGGIGGVDDAGLVLRQAIHEVKPCAVIIDSLPGFAGDDDYIAKDICIGLGVVAVEMNCPIFILEHVNKNLEMGGLMKNQHYVSAVGMMEVDEKSGKRSLFMKKNRVGNAHVRTWFDMTEDRGLVACEDPAIEKARLREAKKAGRAASTESPKKQVTTFDEKSQSGFLKTVDASSCDE